MILFIVVLIEVIAIDYVFSLVDIPIYYYLIAFVVGCVFWRTVNWDIGLLFGYLFLVLATTILVRQSSPGPHFKPEPFWSWRAWDTQRGQIIANVIMFIPIGFLAGYRGGWKSLVVAIVISCLIEVLQLVTGRGLCEFDDVFHNCIGAVVGVVGSMLVRKKIIRSKR